MENTIQLSPKKITNKQFSVDFKGYNGEEVDYFLDMVVADYEIFASMLNAAYDKVEELEKELEEKKVIITKLEKTKSVQEDSIEALKENVSSNVDILKRISLLEKAVFNNNK